MMVKSVRRTCVAAAILVLGSASAVTLASETPHPLKEFGFEATVDDVSRCLAQFSLDNEAIARIEQHLINLGDEDYFVRESASEALLRYHVLPIRLLQEAAQSDDLEVRCRVKRILRSRGVEHSEKMLVAVLRTIQQERFPGFAAEVVHVVSSHDADTLHRIAAEALVATATAEDAGLLRAVLGNDVARIRIAAIEALSAVLKTAALADIKPLLGDPDRHVKLAAAMAVANCGDRACLDTFVELLDADELMVRLHAAEAIRFASGKAFGYKATAPPEERLNATAAWARWARGPGRSAKLRFPIELSGDIPLLAGSSLNGWQAIVGNRVVDHDTLKGLLAVKNGTLKCGAGVRGHLQTERMFTDYRLVVEWRWPENRLGDAGLLLMLSGERGGAAKAVEVQLHQGNAGDFYRIGGFAMGTFRTGVRSRLADSSEKPRGEWNRLEVEVLAGNMTVTINGVQQNKATDCPRQPGRIGLLLEGHPIEFRNIILTPLET